MNYLFPLIETLDDVLPRIKDWEEFRVTEKENYVVVNYMVGLENTFSEISSSWGHSMAVRRECRGLIFDKDSKRIVSRPYHKFFNVNEREETDVKNIDWAKPHHILEKLDGSMIRPIPTELGFRLATKAGITDVAMNAEAFIASIPAYSTFIDMLVESGFTPIFEWCSRQNRIVVDYPVDSLILTGVRGNITGHYLPYNDLVGLANKYSIPVVRAIEFGSGKNFIETVRAWDDGEGVVVRFEDGHMTKIKADAYVLLHKSKEAVSHEKNVIEVVVNDKVDDLLPILYESDHKRLVDFQEKFWRMVGVVAEFLENDYNEGRHISDQKTFAREFVSSRPKKFHGFLYHARKGGNVKDMLIKKISSSLSSRTKVEEARWMWGGLEWNEPVS